MKKYIAILSLFFSVLHAVASISINLEFSKDEGKTWNSDFPTLKKSSTLKVRARFFVQDERDIGVITTILLANEDFASFTQRDNNLYAQRPPIYWANPFRGKYFIYDMDFGDRPAGKIIKKYNHKTKKYDDIELPQCKALEKGSHVFKIIMSYRTRLTNELVQAEHVLYLNIVD